MPCFRKVPDGNGQTITLYESDGKILAGPIALKYWNEVTQMETRDEDVLVCSYPKSGLHWVWEIVRMLKEGTTELSKRRMETGTLLFSTSPEELQKLPNPRVLATHRRFHDLPTEFIVKRRKIVCVVRDPKDTCVSSYHMMKAMKHAEYEGTFNGFVSLFLDGYIPFNSWPGWILSFEKGLKEHPELQVHIVHYEKLKSAPEQEIKRLADYLGVQASEDFVKAVADRTNFSNMKEFKDKVHNPYLSYYKDDGSNHDAIFRKGEIEQWRSYFTAEQAEQFDQVLKKQLGRPSLTPKL